MALVTVKEKYEGTLPAKARKKGDLSVVDILEAKVQGMKMSLSPREKLATIDTIIKKIRNLIKTEAGEVEKRLAKAEEDIKKGRVSRSYTSTKAFLRSLHREAKKLKKNS